MIFVLLLSLFLAGAPQANKNNEPLVSATNPTYLSCTFWTGKTFSKLEARSARTATARSTKGFLAYGEVKVEVQGDDCENTTTLYVATAAGKEFKAVYKKDGGGNGIRIIGWSPDGEHLLAEITSWIYESDTGFEYTPVIYDAASATARENSTLEKALKDHLGNCSYEHNLTQWKTDTQVLVKVSPYVDVDGSDEYSCLKQPKLFLFDLQTGVLAPFLPHPSKSRSTGEGIRRNRVVAARMAVLAHCGSIAALLVGAASPQEPAPQPEKPAEQVYKNIQVFKGLPNSRLLSAMFFMDGSLQVGCGHCHDWEDFSKDDKPAKRTARKMILMVEQLNQTQFEGKQLISCNTCHRGQSPPVAPLPFAKIEEAAPGRPGSKDASTALPSAQELFAREVKAAGGENAMDSIHSRVMHGTRFSSEGWSSPVEIYQQAPDKWRDSFKLKTEWVSAFDGSHGWNLDNQGVHDINPVELEQLKLDADFYRNGKMGQRFLNARATGKEKVNGQDAYVVEAQTPEGDRRELYFDVAKGLLLRIVRFDSSPFGPIPNAVDYADYRELDGVQVPFTISHLRPDYSLIDRLTKIEQNVSIDPKTFNKPIVPEKP